MATDTWRIDDFASETGEDIMKKKQKSRKKKWIVLTAVAAAAVVVIVLFVMPMLTMRNMQAATGAVTQVATAQTGTIEVSVVGSGSLERGGTSYIKIPSSLTPETILVEEGDTVQAGDTLATLDPVKLGSAISDAQSEIDSIDAEIESSQGDTDAQEVTSAVDGRVKQVFVQDGDDVRQVVSESGSLMVLSLDGKMKVTFAASASLAIGDDVVVTLADGTEKDGTVTAAGDEVTVTLTDNGPAVGEQVEIQGEDGEALGSGTLEINAPLEVLAGSGTIGSVDVEENEAVDSGDTLVTLEETVASQEYGTLMTQRGQYADLLRLLLTYAQSGSIVADRDGTVGEILVTADSDEDSSTPTGGGNGVTADADTAGIGGMYTDGIAVYAQPSFGSALTTLASESVLTPATTPISGTIEVPMAAPATGAVPESTLAVAAGSGYTGAVAWDPATAEFAGQTSYTATVTLTADSGYVFDQGTLVHVPGAAIDAQTITISTEASGNKLTFKAVFPATASAAAQPSQGSVQAMPDASSAAQGGAISGGSISSGSVSGGSAGSGSGSTGTGATDTDATDADSSSSNVAPLMQNAFGLVSGDSYELTASIDELDILTLEVGQSATLVLDALPDETFTGTVTRISDTGSSQSGVTTYPVTISIDIPEGTTVKAGMNATVTIVTAVSENVLLIPLSALQELGSEKFVYVVSSGQDEDGTVSGEQRAVETGLSDGVNVEITSGLAEGEMVSYTETTSDSSEGTFMMGGMGIAMDGGSTSFTIEGGGPQGGGSPPDMGGGGNFSPPGQ